MTKIRRRENHGKRHDEDGDYHWRGRVIFLGSVRGVMFAIWIGEQIAAKLQK